MLSLRKKNHFWKVVQDQVNADAKSAQKEEWKKPCHQISNEF